MRRFLAIFLCLSLLTIPNVQAEEPQYVALTFDDGTSGKFTRRLLKGLYDRDAKATFLLCGYRLKQYPDLADQLLEEGHEIGIHGYSHGNMRTMTRTQIAKEIMDTQSGYVILDTRTQEEYDGADIVATTLRDVAFIEVKTRSYDADEWQNAPPPGLAVHPEKQRLTRMAANSYLHAHPTKKRPRMDVIEVWLSREQSGKPPRVLKIHHIKAAY